MLQREDKIKRIATFYTCLLLLTSCANSSPQSFNNCPKLDLTTISSDPQSAQYFDEVAKLVEKTIKPLIGKTEKNVEYCASLEGLSYRVAARDGEFYALTMDYSPTRINVEIVKEKVIKISVG